VRSAFVEADAEAAGAFRRLPRRNETPAEDLIGQSGHGVGVPVGGWLADIYLLARQSLGRLGVESIYGGGYCTASEEARFFSYRRDGVTGRMASLIWLSAE
jgi:copper oxidase (laccase) domain-containing protein